MSIMTWGSEERYTPLWIVSTSSTTSTPAVLLSTKYNRFFMLFNCPVWELPSSYFCCWLSLILVMVVSCEFQLLTFLIFWLVLSNKTKSNNKSHQLQFQTSYEGKKGPYFNPRVSQRPLWLHKWELSPSPPTIPPSSQWTLTPGMSQQEHHIMKCYSTSLSDHVCDHI